MRACIFFGPTQSMDSGKGRKRPWEEGSPIESQQKRRNSSIAAAAFERIPPLPQHVGHHSSNSETLSRRTLPPLYTSPSYIASAGSTPTTSIQATSRPRSQSLFDVSVQNVRQRSDGTLGKTNHHACHGPPVLPRREQLPCTRGAVARQTVHAQTLASSALLKISYSLLSLNAGSTQASARELERDRSALAIGSEAHRPRVGTGLPPGAAGEATCCPSRCQGQDCSKARALIRSLATELLSLDSRVRFFSQKDYSSSTSEASPPLSAFVSRSPKCHVHKKSSTADPLYSRRYLKTSPSETPCNGRLTLRNGSTSIYGTTSTTLTHSAPTRR